jgi:hypothetical protein
MTEKTFKDYAGYYIGCRCVNTWFPEDHPEYDRGWYLRTFRTALDTCNPYGIETLDQEYITSTDSIKPILRKIGDWEGHELSVYNTLLGKTTDGVHSVIIHYDTPESFHWLLKQGFDLFGLIDAGMALDSKTLK